MRSQSEYGSFETKEMIQSISEKKIADFQVNFLFLIQRNGI